MNHPVNLTRAFQDLTDLWSPKVVGRVNDQYVKVARIKGEFTWHKHDGEDELFQVVKGAMRIQFQDAEEVELHAGDFYVVPRGVLHNPIADEECWILLVEPVTTRHTGDVLTPFTRSIDEQLA